jgi:hydroxymethylpyrimidine pyrophosphatase-like HAD family hydrolase
MNKAVIVDLDGTLALVDKRRELARKPNGKLNWDIFLDPENIKLDEPNKPIIELVQLLESVAYSVVIVSGRRHEMLRETILWLIKHNISYNALFIREPKDYRSDVIVKREIYDKYIDGVWDIKWVLDDRKRVVDMWRNELNLTVLHVAEGDH